MKASGGTDANAGLWMAANQLTDTWYSNEKMIILICDGDVDTCTFYNSKSHPGKADSDGDSMNDGTYDSTYIRNFVKVAALSNDMFVPIAKRKTIYYGGARSWWFDLEAISKYGCGVIAMCNTKLYLAVNNLEIGLNYSEEIKFDENVISNIINTKMYFCYLC